ncbi:jupiter microtubule associated homolog 2 [Ascaphus truei]|uniref:jupiter microtubule associated homolog 2 n=1 Tax=Ascaphus truei TaxID=8439 RepID=UPI003F59ED05
MTSTNTFQGLERDAKMSSRVLKPPGGGSSCVFGSSDEPTAPSRPHKMSSNIFGSPVEAQSAPQKSNPPGGKPSGALQDSDPKQMAQRTKAAAGKGNNIFGEAQSLATTKAHPNKPKDNITLHGAGDAQKCAPKKAEPPAAAPREEKKPVVKEQRVVAPDPALTAHEPHLGPRPRSHNRVLNPPGGKSSVTFY